MKELFQYLLKLLNLTDLASIASIAGLLITISVLHTIRKMCTEFLFRARVPDLHRRLQQHAGNISRCLQDHDGFQEQIDEELALVRANLESFKGI
ncbi:MAG: hypothetical protein A3G20_06595 [Acidobacteria bacterium RIFCSPLOWO2_12_FULL_59_11]|nr:MAG: hypothetical protein A3G20_06595 [Acidobacteria bacterium RIFCSPLOWO2_12_FULL_59_11]